MNINPLSIKKYLPANLLLQMGFHPRRLRGTFTTDKSVFDIARDLSELKKINYTIEHFTKNISWLDLPIERAPMARYELLDNIYIEAQKTRRLERCENNILIHLMGNQPFFGEGGCHRLGIALSLGLTSVPVDLGFIYKESER